MSKLCGNKLLSDNNNKKKSEETLLYLYVHNVISVDWNLFVVMISDVEFSFSIMNVWDLCFDWRFVSSDNIVGEFGMAGLSFCFYFNTIKTRLIPYLQSKWCSVW